MAPRKKWLSPCQKTWHEGLNHLAVRSRRVAPRSTVLRKSTACRPECSVTPNLIGRPASASRRNPMICSSVKRFFMSNLLHQWDWTLKLRATQTGGDVGYWTKRQRRPWRHLIERRCKGSVPFTIPWGICIGGRPVGFFYIADCTHHPGIARSARQCRRQLLFKVFFGMSFSQA